MSFWTLFLEAATPVAITTTIRECRDSKDNMMVELAVSGGADLILTGDQDLLALHPFRGIAILNPTQYLALSPPNDLP